MVVVGFLGERKANGLETAMQRKTFPTPANTDVRDYSSVPGLGRSHGERHDNPLQCSCLENPMGRGAWRATDHRVTKSWTRL